jgi:hypothetical protein
MNTYSNYCTGTICIVLILVLTVFIAGCTSVTTSSNGNPPQQSPAANPVPTYQTIYQTIAQTPPAIITTPGQYATTTVSIFSPLGVNITITYPSDWQLEEPSTPATPRDYGRSTINIANFYSPDITPDRALMGQPNIDTSNYTVMSIDMDPQPVSDFEQYFNLVAISLQNTYGEIDITKHNYQLKISKTDIFEGYKSYEMDFDANNLRGSYIFTNVDGTIYIFACKNPSPYSVEVKNMVESIRIISPSSIEVKHR